MPTRLRAAVLAAALTVAGIALITGPAPASAAAPTCANVGIFGVRGSGQTSGFGPEVSASVRSLEQGLRASGRTYAEFPLSYTSASTDLIVPTKPHPQGYLRDVQRYVASVDVGTGALYTSLDRRSRACPNETPALVGYSQGAMVVRNVMQRLAQSGQNHLLTRIGAVGLIADPDKQPNEPNIGSAPAFSIGVASYFRVGGPVAVPAAVLGRAMNACRSHDIACDLSFHASAPVHATYTQTNIPSALGTWLVKATVARNVGPPPGAPKPAPTCSYYDAGDGHTITAVIGSTFTDSLGFSYFVNNDCSLTQVCLYTDAGNGQLISVAAGSTFSDSRGHRYSVSNDCSLTSV